MLVLSRKENEAILVGDSIRVTVVRIGSDKVRIGIEAPDDVRILREELADGGDGLEVEGVAGDRPGNRRDRADSTV